MTADASLYRALVEIAPVGLFRTDGAGACTYVNEQWCALTGFSSEAALGLGWTTALHPDDRAWVSAAWAAAVAAGEPFSAEYRYLRPDGSAVWVLGHAIPEPGDPGGYIGSVTDITRSRDAQRELRDAELRLRVGLAVARIGIAEVDYRSERVRMTGEAAALLGLGDAPLATDRETLHATYHPDDRADILRRLETALDPAGDGVLAMEHRILLADGTVRWVNVRKQVRFGERGGQLEPVSAVLAFDDVTERRANAEALATSEARFRALAEASTQVIWTADADGQLHDAARRWQTLTGLPAEAYPYGEHLARVHPDDRAAGDRAWWAGVASCRAFDFEQRVVVGDGSVRHFLVRGVPVLDASGQVREWVGADIDLTAQRAAAQQLERRAAHHHFLTELRAELDRTPTPDGQFRHAVEAMATFLAVDHVCFWEIEPAAGIATLQACYSRLSLEPEASIAVSRLFDETTRDRLASGEAVAVDDDRAADSTLAAEAFRARVAVPFHDQGIWTRVLTISHASPRSWCAQEIELVRQVGERVWLAAENTRLIASLRERDARFRALADAMPQVVWVADADGTVRYYNGKIADLAGAYQTETGSWEWGPVVAAEDQAATTEAWSRAVATGRPYDIEHRIQMRDGSVRWHLSRAVPMRDAGGAVTAWYGTSTDIHQLKLAELELDQRRREFESLVGNAPDVVARFDRELRHRYVNPAIERLTGIPVAAFIGKTNAELGMAPELVAEWERQSRQVFASGREAYFAFSYAAADGPRHFRTRLVPERDETGAVQTLLAVTYDITKRVAAEDDRERLLDTLVHDLKNPLATLKLQTQLMRHQIERRGMPDADTLLARLAGFEQLGQRTTELVEEITRHARATEQAAALELAPADLAVIARDVVQAARQAHPAHRFVLAVERPVIGQWDAQQLARVASNIVDNAVKYSPGGGTVEVAVHERAGVAQLRVTDEGIGIPEDDLAHIFEYRRRARNVGAIAGGGLGLAGSHRIVEQHGGAIAIASREGAGTTVTVTLPVRPSR